MTASDHRKSISASAGLDDVAPIMDCTISRGYSFSILLEKQHIHRIFKIIVRYFRESTAQKCGAEKEILLKNTLRISVNMSDGSKYIVDSTEKLFEISTKRSKQIQKLEFTSGNYNNRLNVRFDTRFGDTVQIDINGREDRVYHTLSEIEDVISEKKDITKFFSGISSSNISLVLVAVVAIALAKLFALKIDIDPITLSITGLMIFLSAIISIPMEIFKRRWLPKVQFLWGYGEELNRISRIAIYVICITIPGWLLTNLLWPLLVRN